MTQSERKQRRNERKRKNKELGMTIKTETDEKPTEAKLPKLSGEAYEELRQRLRERKKLMKNIPRILLKPSGENAKFEKQSEERVPILLSDVQHLLLYSVLGHHSSFPISWCHLEKFNRISQVSVLVLEGISSEHFISNQSLFPNIKNLLQNQLEVKTPAFYGNSIIEELATVPLSGSQFKNFKEEYDTLENALEYSGEILKRLKLIYPSQIGADGNYGNIEPGEIPESDNFSRTDLLLGPLQMVNANFPLPVEEALLGKYKSYIFTKNHYKPVTAKSPMFGVDCEMCITTSGVSELTRISLVNENLETIYDSFVKPHNRIVNYLTKWSGITPEIMKDVKTRLSDVHKFLRKNLPADAILVGHSLNFDLHALKIMHPYVIDTSVIYNLTGHRNIKTSLKKLSQNFLQMEIQNSAAGHCSIEDATATLKLTQLKLKNSLDFGDEVAGKGEPVEFKEEKEIGEAKPTYREQIVTSFFKHIVGQENKVAIVGSGDILDEYSKFLKSSKLYVASGEEFDEKYNVRLEIQERKKSAIKRLKEILSEQKFNLCHLKIEENELVEEKRDKTLRKVDKYVKQIWENSAPMTLMCVLFGGQANVANGACFVNVKKAEFRK